LHHSEQSKERNPKPNVINKTLAGWLDWDTIKVELIVTVFSQGRVRKKWQSGSTYPG
jgi:hypothetical protein